MLKTSLSSHQIIILAVKMETCINHPTILATGRCKACHRPLCDECKIEKDMGVFCSEDCYERTKQFVERAERIPPPRPSFFAGLMRRLKFLVTLVVVLIVIYGVITIVFGSIEEFFDVIRGLISTVF